MSEAKFCLACGTALAPIEVQEDSGTKTRLRCPACGWTHWNNPTPVLAAVIECVDRDGQVLLARNAAWPGKFFGLVTGFMEAGETPEDGIRREVAEETSLTVDSCAFDNGQHGVDHHLLFLGNGRLSVMNWFSVPPHISVGTTLRIRVRVIRPCGRCS